MIAQQKNQIEGMVGESGLTIDQIQKNLQRSQARDGVDPIIEHSLENIDEPWLGSAHKL